MKSNKVLVFLEGKRDKEFFEQIVIKKIKNKDIEIILLNGCHLQDDSDIRQYIINEDYKDFTKDSLKNILTDNDNVETDISHEFIKNINNWTWYRYA